VRAVVAVELSAALRAGVERERPEVAERLSSLQAQAERMRAVADRLDEEVLATARLLRQMDELLGLAPQLPLDAINEQLRGRRLQEVAVALLRARDDTEPLHYKEWFQMLLDAGGHVGGRDPIAAFLTQVSRAPDVESVRPRSGLYRLRVA
jgi:nitrogen fixation/metabolism regulation signal transduction histidine kinase